MQVSKSNKLANVCYDIRGPVLKHAKRLEEEGHRILKLNIGNPAPFGFEAPEEILQDVIRNLPTAQGYSDSKGLFSARKAIMQYARVHPERVCIMDMRRLESGDWWFEICGFGLGSLHMICNDPREVTRVIQFAQKESSELPA